MVAVAGLAGTGMTMFTLVVAVFGMRLVGLLTGHEYPGYETILILLAVSQFVFSQGIIIYQGLTMLNQTRFNFLVSIIGLVVTLITGAILVAVAGIHGAAWGYLITNLTFLSIRGVYFFWLIRIPEEAPLTLEPTEVVTG